MRRKRWWGHRSLRFDPHKYSLVIISVSLQKTQSKTCCSACQTRPRVRLMCYHVNSQETIWRAYRSESNSRGAAFRPLRVFISEELYRYKHLFLKLVKTVLEEALTLAASKRPNCAWWGGGQRPRVQPQHVRLGWTLPQVTVFEEADSKPTVHHLAEDYRTPEEQRSAVVFIWDFKIVWRILCHYGDWIIYPPTDERVVYALWHGRIDPKTLRFISGNLIFTILRAQKQKHLPGASTHYVFYYMLLSFFFNFGGALGRRTSCRQNVAHLYWKLIQCGKEQHINDHN